MKKILSIFLIVAAMAVNLYSQGLTFRVDSVSAVQGDSVVVPVYVSGFHNIGSFTLYIGYNNSMTSWGRGLNWHPDLVADQPLVNAGAGMIVLAWANVNGVSLTDGKLLDLKFLYNGNTWPYSFLSYCEVTDVFGNTVTPDPAYIDGLIVPRMTIAPSASPTIICLQDSAQLHANAQYGFESYSYQWSSNPAGFSSIQASPMVSPTVPTTYQVIVTDGDFTDTSEVFLDLYPDLTPTAVSSMIPNDSVGDLSKPISMSWYPGAHATRYDIYIWESGTSPVGSLRISNLTSINTTYSGILEYEKSYDWQIYAKNNCASTAGPVQSFSMRYLPDLVINSLLTPSTIYAGQPLTVSWEVHNTGLGGSLSQQWYDGAYLSLDTVFDSGDIFLGNVGNLSALDTSESYVMTQEFTIPSTLFGDFYVIMVADIYNHLLESNEGNNWLFDASGASLDVQLPPKPDLTPTSVGVPTSVYSGNSISVNYLVKNDGFANAQGFSSHAYFGYENWQTCVWYEHFWTDRIYISAEPTFSYNTAVLLANVDVSLRSEELGEPTGCYNPNWYSTPDYLEPDSSYAMIMDVDIPHNYYGTYYIYVLTDVHHGVQELSDMNNWRRSNPIDVNLTPPPNLEVNIVSTVPSAGSGDTIRIYWTVENTGANPPVETSWRDRVYFSTVDTFNFGLCSNIGTKYRYNGNLLTPYSTYVDSIDYILPNGISGQFYIYVYTDAYNDVFEFTFENDNVKRSAIPLNVSLSPYPDLVITDIDLGTISGSGDVVPITWTVKNQGNGPSSGYWKDRVFISQSATWGASASALLTSSYSGSLAVESEYTKTGNITIPGNLNGIYYIYVKTDFSNYVYEYIYEGNNVANAGSFVDTTNTGQVIPPPVIVIVPDTTQSDLNVVSFSAPAIGWSGSNFTVSWEVENIGEEATDEDNWQDRIYLSTDNVLSSDDDIFTTKYHSGELQIGGSYSVTQSKVLENGVSGTYYLLFYTDFSDWLTDELSDANNYAVQEITINLSPPPDLVVDGFSCPATAISGQGITVQYSVLNQGTGPVAASHWYDRVFISTTPDLTGWSSVIKYKTTHSPLPAGSDYSGNLSFNLPSYAVGFYYLVYSADHNHNVYEHGQEGNNLGYGLINIVQPEPSDLKISAITIPDSVTLGDDVNIAYTVENVGQNPAVGSLRDAFYFSEDTIFDGAIDKLLNIKDKNVYIQPGQVITDVISGKTPNVLPGDYFGVGRTNILNQIYESVETNNDTITSETINVDIEVLELDVVKTTDLDEDDLKYYKVDVAADLDLLITLTSNVSHGSNEVYVAYERVPAANDFDYIFEYPQQVDQKVLIPTTQAGTYYVLVKTPINYFGLQTVDILAQALPFSILEITPDTVGAGVVTNEFIGAGFKTVTEFYLFQTGTQYTQGNIANYINSMNVEITWDLENVPLGIYDVVAVNPDTTITYPNGITIEEATGFLVDYNYVSPNVLRVGRTGSYTFFFQNIGNVDIPFTKADIAVPNYTNILALNTSSEVMLRSDFLDFLGIESEDYQSMESVKLIPFFRKDFRPGDVMSVSMIVGGFAEGIFTINLRAYGFSTEDFIIEQLQLAESTRQAMEAYPGLFGISQHPELMTFVNDCEAFRDTVYHAYVMMGLLQTADSVGMDLSCATLSEGVNTSFAPISFDGEYTFDPGTSPGLLTMPVTSFDSGDDYLWEINKYGGTAGVDPGWDLVHCTGQIHVNASSTDPFIIRVASINYWDQPDYLAGWYPAVDKCWPIAIADDGFVGFDTSKFAIDLSRFTYSNYTYGGTFSLQLQGTDTLLLCFTAYVPGPGEDGVPGAPGAPGEDGSPGGQGGIGIPVLGILPGMGGIGGAGGPGIPNLGILPGNGGPGGQGGDGGDGQDGGQGGQGGNGGNGGYGQNGGQGGSGGWGGTGGQDGNGGQGGTAGLGGAAGPYLPPFIPPEHGFGGPPGLGGFAGISVNIPTFDGPPGAILPQGYIIIDYSNSNINESTQGEPPGDLPGGTPIPVEYSNYTGEDVPPTNTTTSGEIPCGASNLTQLVCGPILKAIGCVTAILGCYAVWVAAGTIIPGLGTVVGLALGTIACGVSLAKCIGDVTGLNVKPHPGLNLVGCIKDLGGAAECAAEAICNWVLKTCDPNDIIGPPGYGESKFVAQNELLPYTIRFENDSAFATTAAQRVEIRQQIPPTLNPLSFRLSDFGFGTHLFNVPENSAAYFTVIDMVDSLGWDVEVTAGIDIVDNEMFWIFQTIDPATGLPPTDAYAGFLAINDSLGAGEGFVSYTIKPKNTTQTGDTIYAEAEIIFDINEPILTPEIFNTIDAGIPSSMVAALPGVSDTTIYIDFIGADDTGGSGIKSYKLYVSEEGGPWQYEGEFLVSEQATYTGVDNTTYSFFSRAVDNVWYEEGIKNYAEATTIVNPDALTLGGIVKYDNAGNEPIEGAMIIAKDLQGNPVDTAYSDIIGNYYFSALPVNEYQLFTEIPLPWGGGNATDALIINKYTVGANSLSDFRQQVADVNASTTVNATDGLLIKRRTIGSLIAFPSGDWYAESPQINLESNMVLDITAACYGDVNGSYSGFGNFSKSTYGSVDMINQGEVSVVSGSDLVVDINVEEQIEAGAITLHIGFDNSLLELLNVSCDIPDVMYKFHDGHLSIAWESLQAINFSDDDRLLSLKFRSKITNESTSAKLSVYGESEFADRNAVVIPKVSLTYPEILILKKGEFALNHNYPNPFSDYTEISYSMPEAGNVQLSVNNSLGEYIDILVNEYQEPGNHTVRYDGHGLASGIYQYKITINGQSEIFSKTNMMIINR